MTDHASSHILQCAPMGIVLMDKTGRVILANRRAQEIFRTGPQGILRNAGIEDGASGGSIDAINQVFNFENQFVQAVIKTQRAVFDIHHMLRKTDGTVAAISVNVGPVSDDKNRLAQIIATVEDISEQQMGEQGREKFIQELSNQSRQLEELHSGLKSMIALREKEISDLEERIVFNLKRMVIPYMEKLSRSRLNDDSRIYLEIALTNIIDICSSFGSTLTSKTFRLTPRELEVADMVRQEKSNKEIAEVLHISVRSVESHRRWIRRKLGLHGKKTNLRTFLLSKA